MQLSVVIPAHNEAGSLAALLQEVQYVLKPLFEFEVIVVDDGSTDETSGLLNALKYDFVDLRVIRHRASCGQSTALMTGVEAATAPLVATLDGDGQNDPCDLPAMISVIENSMASDRVHMAAGFRYKRRDSWWRIASSRFANAVRCRILGDRTPDTGCGIKVFDREAFLKLPRFNHMHRFLPALIVRSGGRVVSVPVNHRPRLHGRSHYDTLRRLFAGIVDLAGVAWLIRRNRLPHIEQMDLAHDERTGLDRMRFDRAAAVHRPVRRAVA